MKQCKSFFNNNSTFHLKNSSVNKITLHQRFFLSQEDNNNSKISQNNNLLKNKKIFSLKRIFRQPKNYNNNQKIWPKVTHPKLPFSREYLKSEDSKKITIKLKKPSKLLHEFNTIKWLRNKYSDSVVEKSIQSILPKKDNSFKYKNEKEHQKRFRKMIEYLENLKGPIGREKFIEINPKYLFDETTFKSILKLKEVFLEFDLSGNQKMEFDEIVKMFNQNHISAGKRDILNLFFKNKVIKTKKDILKLHLGFYQFIIFALKKEQNFRNFMRKIKSDHKKTEKKEKYNKDKESVYLPMNFNLILDYFIKKEKEKHTIKKIKNAFDKLDNDIKNESKRKTLINYVDQNKLNDIMHNIESLRKNSKYSKLKNDNNLKLKTNNNLSEINIIDLFNEFIKLFHLSCKNGENEDKNINIIKNEFKDSSTNLRYKTESQKPTIDFDNSILSYNRYNLKNLKNNKIKNRNKNSVYLIYHNSTKYNKSCENDDNLITIIKNQMNRKLVDRINIEIFNKYHDLNLAKNEALKQINKEFELDKLYNIKKEKRRSSIILNNDGNIYLKKEKEKRRSSLILNTNENKINLKTINFSSKKNQNK